MLNEDCLLHLFKFLDVDSLVTMANICQMFNRLLHRHCFPNIRKYDVYTGYDPNFTLAQLHRKMLCIGKHITDLSIVDGNNDYVRTFKYFRVIAQNVSQNMHHANLKINLDKDHRDHYIGALTPILGNLKSLEIWNTADIDECVDIDFPILCPKLVEFKLNMNMPMNVCCKPWPRLRRLSVQYNRALTTTTLISFIKQNPQLICLEFATDKSNKTLQILAILKLLSKFEKLTITSTNDESFAKNFINLSNMPYLCEIILEYLCKSTLKLIINHLSTFTNLRLIKLHSNDIIEIDMDYKQSFVNLAKNLPHLEELDLNSISMNDDILINFIRSACQLKTLYIRHCELDFSDDLVVKLVDALKASRQESNEVLRMFVDIENSKNFDATKNEEFDRYLILKYH